MTVQVLPRLLARNWRLKLAAVGVAVFLWALVRVESPSRRSLPVPVRVQLTDPGYMLLGEPAPEFVTVRFAGPVREIIRLALDGTAVMVPVNEVTQRELNVQLQAGWIPVEGYRGVQVEDFMPSTVHLHLEPMESAIVGLRLSTTGEVPERLALTRAISLAPGVVRVRGPASLVGELDSLSILPVDLGDVTDSGVLEAVVDTAGLGVIVEPSQVRVLVPVEESTNRRLTGVPVRAGDGSLGSGIVVVPPSVGLTLTGARSRVEGYNPSDLRVFVPPYALLGMRPSEERKVPLQIEGLPSYVSATMDVDSVVVRRQIDR